MAHAGCLSFEFSLGAERVVVNCGAPPPPGGDARELARATAAHSTLVLGDHSSARIAPVDSVPGLAGRIIAGPSNVHVERREGEGATALLLTHDGYAREFGLIHGRDLALARDGSVLSGRDRLFACETARARNAPEEFALRFHLHPRVRVTGGGASAELALANGVTLLFEAEGGEMRIEDSIFFASVGGARRTSQIVLRGKAAAGVDLRWSFRSAGAVSRSRNA
jgi:uncharacterized heparinase superfamily protein